MNEYRYPIHAPLNSYLDDEWHHFAPRDHHYLSPIQTQYYAPYQHFLPFPPDLSPATDSSSSVSPLSPYSDLSYVCHESKSWQDTPMNNMVENLGIGMAGVVVGGMPVHASVLENPVIEDEGGDEDAEGEEDWDHANVQTVQQPHYRVVQQYVPEPVLPPPELPEHDDPEDEHVASPIDAAAPSPSVPASYSEQSESEDTDDDDDPDDPEFVPRARTRPLRRQSTFPSGSRSVPGGGGGGHGPAGSYQTFAYSNIMGEGRSLRPRSNSARYNPYPAAGPSSYPQSAGSYFDSEFEQQQQSPYTPARRYSSTSTTSTSYTTQQQPRSPSAFSDSGSGSVSGQTSSGTTTTLTTTARRRLRPSSTLPVPVPVPNLTKKSRGRRVPTMESLEDMRSAASGAGRKRISAVNGGAGKSARMYLCDVEGCGKCFARGEHLKRHVRSIHTYEKPHKCLYPGCGKDFSRHDNLGQHMRVHKDYVQEGVTLSTSGSTSLSPSGSATSSSRRKAQAQAAN